MFSCKNLPNILTSAELPVKPCKSNTALLPFSNRNGCGGVIFIVNIAPWFFLEVDWSEVDVIFVGVLGDWLYLIICASLFGLFVHFF
ncbi:hypothetical protein LM7420_260054 [Listeria monocytogenes]|nr:hypothetical protein LM7420_260054 [Listeria monocytogenes]CUL45924.1 hypothetical protein LM7421_260054 [Listeria monocytogenes]CUL46702.1 hypothetical protein LM7422_230054 [Listeria monocytogenes]